MKNIYDVISKANIALVVTGLILGGYLLVSMAHPYNVGSFGKRQVSVQSLESATRALSALPQYDADAFKKSELFSASGKKTVSQDTKSIVLVGVSMGEKKLAIIRNTKTNKDYYCTEGDIAGDYTIKQILKDKVILESEGNTLELIR